MLTINIVCVGKIKEQYLKDAITEYSKRLSRYCKLHIIEVPDEKIPDKLNNTISEEIKEKECLNISNHLPKDTFPICLDLKGKEFSSEEFSKNIETLSLVTSSITFIIGGSLGITQLEFFYLSKFTEPLKFLMVKLIINNLYFIVEK